jgi:hypothetical protein
MRATSVCRCGFPSDVTSCGCVCSLLSDCLSVADLTLTERNLYPAGGSTEHSS